MSLLFKDLFIIEFIICDYFRRRSSTSFSGARSKHIGTRISSIYLVFDHNTSQRIILVDYDSFRSIRLDRLRRRLQSRSPHLLRHFTLYYTQSVDHWCHFIFAFCSYQPCHRIRHCFALHCVLLYVSFIFFDFIKQTKLISFDKGVVIAVSDIIDIITTCCICSSSKKKHRYVFTIVFFPNFTWCAESCIGLVTIRWSSTTTVTSLASWWHSIDRKKKNKLILYVCVTTIRKSIL